MWRLFILFFCISSVRSGLVKYRHGNESIHYWNLADHPDRPCRAEEGWIRCETYQICELRYFWNECPANNLTQCNDEEYEEIDIYKMCIRREEIQELSSFQKYYPCHYDEYECGTSKKCIPRGWVQDGVDDCSMFLDRDIWSYIEPILDGIDEVHALENCYNETEYQCTGNRTRCIPRHLVMNGIPDCPNKEDEHIRLECHNNTEFKCSDNDRCIPRRYVNDGFGDCLNNDDENITSFTCNDRFEYSCNNTNEFNQCIPREWVRNGVNDCANGADETAIISECYDETEFSCLDNKRCLPYKYLCDGIQNCADGSDEIELCDSPTMYRYGSTRPLVPWHYLLFHGEETLLLKHPDFTQNHDLLLGFKCKINRIDYVSNQNIVSTNLRNIPQLYINNNMSLCFNKDDICFDNEGNFQCARCLDGTIISKSQVCDAMIDCKDMSDECACEESKIEELCAKLFPFQNETEENMYTFDMICNGKEEMLNGIDERYCQTEVLLLNFGGSTYKSDVENRTNFKCSSQYPGSSLDKHVNASFCNGHADCPLMEDECSSDCLMNNIKNETIQRCFPFLHRTDSLYTDADGDLWYKTSFTASGDQQLITNSGQQADCVFIINTTYPMFVRHLPNISQTGCVVNYGNYENFNFLCDVIGVSCPWMYSCDAKQSKKIEVLKRCDYKNDCGDNTDEMDCSSETHFYCENANPLFIPRSKVTDGRSDCSDRSDECRETVFSSASEMLKNIVLKILIWLCAILILIFNALLITKHVRKIRKTPSMATAPYCNIFLLINLACSDMIFGFVLLTIGVKAEQFSGEYCEHDLAWRSSLTCDMIGIFTVISTQTSMNLLVLMTGLRAYITSRPYMANRLNINRLKIATFAAFGISVVLASYPIWGNSSFIHYFYIKPNLFLKDQIVKRSHLESYVERTETIALLRTFNGEATANKHDSFITDILKSWVFNTENGKSRFPNRHVDIKANFGFYSSSSVCFPDLYSQYSSTSNYSLFLVLYNFCCLVAIAMGYCFIFYEARKSVTTAQTADEARANRKMNKMMKRIFFIVVTDMLCWLPIIAMSIHTYRGYQLPEIVHALSAIVFLPINSLINPIIYSRLDKAARRKFQKLWGCIRGGSSSDDDSVHPRVTEIQMSVISQSVERN